MMSSNTSPIADPVPSLSNRLANSPQSGEYIPHDLYPIYVHYMYVCKCMYVCVCVCTCT